jgi:hypothetical protein
MKDATTSKEAEKIFNAMADRFAELWDKLVKGNYNLATPFAYRIGFISDIDGALKKMKIKRTIIKHKDVHEIELKDIKPLLDELKPPRPPKRMKNAR